MNTPQNPNCINILLSPVVVEALQNDKHLVELYKRLNELYSKAIPQVIQVSPTKFRANYPDVFNELVSRIQTEINHRQEQIISFYNFNC